LGPFSLDGRGAPHAQTEQHRKAVARLHASLDAPERNTIYPVLRWLTANIGIHHVHHLANRIPHCRLPEVLRDYPELRSVGRIGILDGLGGMKLALWDENRRKLVSFRQARAA
jgi:acyl-lipid omega-6 desaturase (Delta-12 desaturase)